MYLVRCSIISCCFVFFQGIWVWVILLPTLIVNSKSVDTKFCVSDYIGWSLWLFGMLLECVADYQKYVFRGESANKYVDMRYLTPANHV